MTNDDMKKEVNRMDNKIRVSIIIPAYNAENTIAKTLNSVEAQTYKHYISEIIVVNDGSTDGTLGVLGNYVKQSQGNILVYNQKNTGVSSARNKGMEKAKGNWLAFLDSDDEWLPYKLERQIKIIKMYPEIDFLGANMDDRELRVFKKKITGLYKASVKDLCITNFPQPSTVIMKKEIYENIGGFDEEQRYAEDGNYFLKICSEYNFYHLAEKLIVYGAGKRGFGDSGLSANLKAMYKGNIKNIRYLKKEKLISSNFYRFLVSFYYLKYVRRIVITHFML